MGTEDKEKLVLRSYEHWCCAYDEAQTADNICARKHALHAISEYVWQDAVDAAKAAQDTIPGLQDTAQKSIKPIKTAKLDLRAAESDLAEAQIDRDKKLKKKGKPLKLAEKKLIEVQATRDAVAQRLEDCKWEKVRSEFTVEAAEAAALALENAIPFRRAEANVCKVEAVKALRVLGMAKLSERTGEADYVYRRCIYVEQRAELPTAFGLLLFRKRQSIRVRQHVESEARFAAEQQNEARDYYEKYVAPPKPPPPPPHRASAQDRRHHPSPLLPVPGRSAHRPAGLGRESV